MPKKTKPALKGWGPLLINIDSKTKNMWGALSKESIDKIMQNLELSRKEGISKVEFMHVLELASRPKQRAKGKKKT
jgi:hypothetical protein